MPGGLFQDAILRPLWLKPIRKRLDDQSPVTAGRIKKYTSAMQTFLTQHAVLAGWFSLLQLVILPGLLIWRWPPIGGWLALPLGLMLGLLLNFQLAFYLAIFGLYRVESLATVIFLWLIMAASVRSISSSGTLRRSSQDALQTPHSLVLHAASLSLALLALGALGWSLRGHVPGVFDAWDAVISWNRWATEWAGNRLPEATYGYPQLVPSALATTYVWIGTPQIEFFAKGLLLAFPLGVVALLTDMYVRFRWPAALLAMALWCFSLLWVFPELVDSGYVEIPVAFFVALTAYLVLLAQQKVLPPATALLLAAMSAAAAVLTKQTGAAAVVLVLWGVLDGRIHPALGHPRRRLVIQVAVLLAAQVMPWYGYKYYQIITGSDPVYYDYLTSGIFAGETLAQRVWRATTVMLPTTLQAAGSVPVMVAAMLVLGAASLRTAWGRICWLGLVLPHYLVWALFFSYDMRNLVPALPFVCMGLALGLQSLWPGSNLDRSVWQLAHIGNALPAQRWSGRLVLALLVLLTALAWSSKRSQNDLLALNERTRLMVQDTAFNQQLLAYAQTPGFAGKILSTYAPVAIISGLREHFYLPQPDNSIASVAVNAAIGRKQPLCQVLGLMPRHETLRYLLVHNGIYTEMLKTALDNGSLKLILQTPDIRLLEVACPP
jgi:hypothetical protein